jgi:hypothetical protein
LVEGAAGRLKSGPAAQPASIAEINSVVEESLWIDTGLSRAKFIQQRLKLPIAIITRWLKGSSMFATLWQPCCCKKIGADNRSDKLR